MSGWVLQLVFAAAAVGVAAVAADDRPPDIETVFTFSDPEIDESSGLAVQGDRVLTVDDSGDGPVVYVVDGKSGDTVGHTTYSQGPVEDVEAMALGPDGSVWVGDIGDNEAGRDSVSVYRLPPVEDGDHTVTAERYKLRYSTGPQNAETLLVDPRDGRLYVVSKGVLGGRVYAAPRKLSSDSTNLLEPVGDARGVVTDGDFFPDGAHAVLRTYGSALVFDTSTWEAKFSMKLPPQKQGEGLTVTDGGRRVLVSSEGVNTPVLSVALSDGMLRAAGATTSTNGGAHNSTTTPAASEDTKGPLRDPVVLIAAGAAVVAVMLAVGGLLRRRGQSRSTT
jgi:hypothetical protein